MELMNDFEVVEHLKNGGKAKHKNWRNGFYVYYDFDDSVIRDENDSEYKIALCDNLEFPKWEVYDDRKELPKGMEFLKDMLWDGKKVTCYGVECKTCIFKDFNCTTLREALRNYRKEYKL